MPKKEKLKKIRVGKRVRPPKKWFYKTLKKVRKYEDGIKDPEAVVGYIWHNLAKSKQIEIIKRKNPRKKRKGNPILKIPKAKLKIDVGFDI